MGWLYAGLATADSNAHVTASAALLTKDRALAPGPRLVCLLECNCAGMEGNNGSLGGCLLS